MPTSVPTTDNMTAIAELVLDGATTAQDAILSAVTSFADTIKPVTEKLQSLPFADLAPNPAETIDAAFGFAEKVLASQKDFASKLVSAYGLDKA
jgi:hypothetical protein